MSEWRKIALGQVCSKIGSGATPRGGKEVYVEQGPYALIRSQNVYNDGFRRDGLAYIGKQHADELQNVEVLEGDVLLNITGDSVARVCQVAPDVLPARVNQHVAIIRPDSVNLNAAYLHYYLLSPIVQTMLLSWAGSGGTRNAITKGMIESLIITLPSLAEQRAISHFLGTFDKKIELNRRANVTLEAMARTLFKSWFVDFDPIRAKMEGRWRRGESHPGLPAEHYDLFPYRLVDSELGEIPEGWEVKALGDVSDVVGGTTPSTKVTEYWEGGNHCWATPKDLSALSSPVLLDTERKITDSGLRHIGSGLLPVGTLLLSSRAPIGYLAMSEQTTTINQGFIAMPPHKGTSNLFMLHWCGVFHNEIINHANGSTFLEISKSNFRRIPLVVPTEAAMTAFDGLARTLHEHVVSNVRESRVLAVQQDEFLPRLVSGKLGVNE